MIRPTVVVIPPERRETMQLQDSRTLAWSEWGPIDGLPVLFCTGAAMSSWLGFGTDVLPDLSLKLIAIDRPGLGLSDPHPDKTLSSWVEDIREFIQANHLRAVLAVGFSQGAPFAFALASQHLVEAIAIVSGQDELTHPGLKSLLHPDVAGMIAAIQQNPEEFEQHFSQIATPEGLWQLVISMSGERDRLIYQREDFSQAFQRALQEGFSQGPQGYVRDLINTYSAWPINLEEINVPVDLWYGKLDTSPGHSPDFGATLATRLSNASHTLDPQEGGSILWTRSHNILTHLKSHLSAR